MMHVQSNHTTPVAGEKRPKPLKKDPPQPASDTRKVASFIQRFYLFGTNTGADKSDSADYGQPKVKKAKAEGDIECRRELHESPASSAVESNGTQSSSSPDSSPVQYPSYSVQRLRQFWNNRLLSSATTPPIGGTAIDTLVRKAKSATIGTPTGAASRCATWKSASPKAGSRFQRNGSLRRSGKRTSNAALLSPDRDTPKVEKRQCVSTGGSGVGGGLPALVVPSSIPAGATVRDSFPLATATPSGNQIHWARRKELLGIRALTQDEKQAKMPIRVENYVNNFIGVDIQNITGPEDGLEASVCTTTASNVNDKHETTAEMNLQHDSVEESVDEGCTPNACTLSPEPALPSTSSLGRKGNTPTRKISFMNNISPYNRRLLAGNGTKVAALTNKFNQMIQQDAGLLEQVKKRGGYIHKCGNVAYKVVEDTGRSVGADAYGFAVASRNGSGRASLRKKNSNASNAGSSGNSSTAGSACRTDESSDDISSASSKSSSIRKTGVKKRPSLRKNIYRRPEWGEMSRSSLGVRKVLEIFEPNVQHATPRSRKTDGAGASSHGDTGKPPPGRSKPKVPDKSEQLLQKTKGVKSKKVRPVSSSGEEVDATLDGTLEKEDCSVAVSRTELHTPEIPEDTTNQSTVTTETSVIENSRQSTASGGENPCKEANIVQPSVESVINIDSKEKAIQSKETKEKKKSKSAVSKIYERLTFRSSKKIQIETSGPPDTPVEVVLRDDPGEKTASGSTRRSFISSIEIPTIQIDGPQSAQSLESERDLEMEVSEQKILEAICAASHRIDNLSKSFNDLTLNDPDEARGTKEGESHRPSGDNLPVRPNASFLFRGAGSGSLSYGEKNASQINIVEAVNTVVINKAVSMDDHHFPCARGTVYRMSLNERRDRVQRDLEDDYEPVTKPEERQQIGAQLMAISEKQSVPCSSPTVSIDLTELTSKIESFIHKSKRESENIYQSISRSNSRRGDTLATHLIPEDTISINSYESFENYESIELELGANPQTKNASTDAAAKEEDTYEICSPPPDLPPARDETRNDLTLPQPKRNLSSSPKTLPKHLQVTYQSNYEMIKYSKIPPRPPKPEEVPLPPRNNSSVASNDPISSSAEGDRLNVTFESIASGELPKPEEVPLPPRNNLIGSSSTNTRALGDVLSPTSVSDRLNVTLESISSTELQLSPGGDLLDKSPQGPQEYGRAQQENIYEENIYDFIRSADGVDYDDPACGGSAELELPVPDRRLYEQQQEKQMLQPERLRKQPPSPPGDNVSLVSSNCYESIGSRLEFVRNMALNRRNIGGSTTTLASENITNSLYGTTAGLASLTPPSERGSDTSNSADWTDISDEDEGGGRSDGMVSSGTTASKRPNFIVVRERKRTHQTPLRSRKLPRITHPKTDDDSDHHYESLYSIGANDSYRNGSERSRASSSVEPLQQPMQQEQQKAQFSDGSFHEHRSDLPDNHDDEFDSFDSDDTEEDEEGEERCRHRTDSGVYIRNAKLPDPPPSSSQVYVLVQKIKNLGTLSKSEIAKGFHKLSKKKSPKASGAGGGGGPGGGTVTYENSPTVLPPKPSSKTASKSSGRAFKLPIPLGGAGGVPKPPPEDYENASFGKGGPSPLPPVSPLPLQQSSPLSGPQPPPPPPSGSSTLFSSPSASEQALADSLARSTSESSNVSGTRPLGEPLSEATRKKSKSSKSLRSKLRKSLVSDTTGHTMGSSFHGSRSTFYVSTSTADVDSGIFNGTEPSSCQAPSNDGLKLGDVRRKSIALGTMGSNRPSIPPPPPPAEAGLSRKGTGSSTSNGSSTRKLGATSWYAECAVFKQPHSFGTDSDQSSLAKGAGGSSPRSPLPPKDIGSVQGGNGATATASASSWYADIYQTSGASVASSSESSGVSTGGEGGPGDDHSHSMFVNEPLYQIYNAAKLESITRDIDAEISGQTMEELYDDGYEKISERNRRRAEEQHGDGGSSCGGSDGDDRSETSSLHLRKPSRPTALELIEPHVGNMHRKLEKRGELVHLLWRGDDAKLTFGKKFSKSNLYAFLFTDLLVLTKKKSDESFLVTDYCQRALLTVSSGDVVPGLPAKEMQTIGKNLIIMTLLENHEGKTVEMILSCPSETERERWLTVTEPPASENPDEKIYEQWNCPQVIAVHPYQALQPDELDLDIKDVVNVHRKMADGHHHYQNHYGKK
ncbi:AGAP007452-PA-like protein [Anopheles sinensis]|uniref:AGAP007452-PA-like protein n=1 Tax=Anopheles sinensis TaxID=74873 RepID=A0A084WN84_ANOSI|nr:AGAP007452-PA-like protein [Anopheles sinensis]